MGTAGTITNADLSGQRFGLYMYNLGGVVP